MWFKFIYYLRATEETGWLIFMIRKVIIDMGPFMLVLLVTIMAFADAFYTISNSQTSSAHFIHNYPMAIFYAY